MVRSPENTAPEILELLRFLEGTPALLFTLDAAGCVVTVTSRWCNLFGYPRRAVVGQPLSAFCRGAERERLHEGLQSARASGESEFGVALLDSAYRSRECWVVATSHRVGADPGTAEWHLHLMLTPSAATKTPRPRAPEEASYEARLAASLFEWAPEAIVLADPGRRIVRLNRAAERLFGHTSERARGQLTKVLYADPGDFYASGRSHFHAQAEPGTTPYHVRYRRHDGSTFLGETIGNALRQPDGELDGFVGLIRDVTREVEAKEKLAATNRNLQATLDALDQFAHIASHDLRTPLRGIAHLKRFIEEESPPPLLAAIEPRLDQLGERVRKMDGLLTALLRYARASYESTTLEPTHIPQVFAEAVAVVRDAYAGSRDVFVELEVAGEVPPELYLDKLVLGQTLQNLLDNAVKHHDKRRCHVRVTVESLDNCAWFHIQDDGPGIPPRHHTRVFEIFRTLNGAGTENSGMGLSLVQRLVLRAGGVIRVQSPTSRDRGTRLSFSLPARTTPPLAAEHPSSPPPARDS